MKQICYSLIAGLLFSASACRTAPAEAPVAKQKLMWLDCSANWERFSDPIRSATTPRSAAKRA